MPINKRLCFSSWQWIVLCRKVGQFLAASPCVVRTNWGISRNLMSGRTIESVVVGAILARTLVAETHKDFRFTVGPKAGVSVTNPYGSISVKPSTSNVVVINAVLASDKVEVDNNLVGNRVEIQSHLLPGADAQSGRVDYEIQVPADASITLHSSTGPLRAEKLHG